jgi:hypothetical protein
MRSGRRAAPPTISARLSGHVTLEARANGEIAACFDGYSVGLGTFSAGAAERAQDLRVGLPLASFASGGREIDKEIRLLVRRLARHGLLEYRVARSRNDDDQIIIQPQAPDYWPRTPQLGNADVLVLSRFAYLRRRGNEMVLESPRAGALFKICDPKIATAIAMLSSPQQIKQLRRQDGFPGVELLALLVDCQILFKIDAASQSGLRPAEGDDNLVLWDFHDLLFHTARKADPATRWAEFIHMRASFRRYRRCGPAGPERKLICASSRPRIRSQSRRSQSSCVNVIRHAASMTSDRSRSLSFRGFSTAPRGSCREGKAGSTSPMPVR